MNDRKKYHKDYYLKNKENINLKGQEYYQENKDKVAIRIKKYYSKFPWIRKVIAAHHRCENVNDISYKNYGGKGIKCLLTFDEAKTLWFRDKAWELKEPSLDRIESNKDYTFDNCRFIEKRVNSKLRSYDMHKKKVRQYGAMSGLFLKEFDSITEAEKYLGVGRNSLYPILNSTREFKLYKGYEWSYA